MRVCPERKDEISERLEGAELDFVRVERKGVIDGWRWVRSVYRRWADSLLDVKMRALGDPVGAEDFDGRMACENRWEGATGSENPD